MGLLNDLDLDHLGPARLWVALDAETRTQCARAMYREDEQRRQEANAAIAAHMRFRPEFVRRLPLDKRVAYLARQVRADDGLAGSLLLALHLEDRSELLGAFLDRLGIPHVGGVIDEHHALTRRTAEELEVPVDELLARFPTRDVELYLASLIALDRDTWGGLVDVLRARTG